MTDAAGGDRPDWWRQNDAIRAEMGLPSYEPPRFRDGTYTHEVVDPLAERHGCQIRLMAVDPRYGDDWEVRVDGDPVLTVGRHRDDRGNTVYEADAAEIRAAIEAAVGDE